MYDKDIIEDVVYQGRVYHTSTPQFNSVWISMVHATAAPTPPYTKPYAVAIA